MVPDNSRNKPITQIDTEKLLESLNQDDDDTILEYSDNVVPFLSKFHIEPGAFPVDKRLLYKLYSLSTKEKVTFRQFTSRAGLYLQRKQTYFLINLNAIEISKKIFKQEKKKQLNYTTSPKFKKHFNNFVEKFDLNKADGWVESYVIYFIYDNWCYSIKRAPMGRKKFYKFLDLYFQKKWVNNGHYVYRVSKQIKETLSEETLKNLKQKTTG